MCAAKFYANAVREMIVSYIYDLYDQTNGMTANSFPFRTFPLKQAQHILEVVYFKYNPKDRNPYDAPAYMLILHLVLPNQIL